MRNLWKSVFGLWVICTGLGVIAPAQATSAAGPYYATPSWDQTLPAATRFIVLTNMNSEAVLDRETGLVWEQSPSTSPVTWIEGSFLCLALNKGGRKGWRLPTIQDLASLVDATQLDPALPPGHPFGNVQSSDYWSATNNGDSGLSAFIVFFHNGDVHGGTKTDPRPAWCVRGGQGSDAQ